MLLIEGVDGDGNKRKLTITSGQGAALLSIWEPDGQSEFWGVKLASFVLADPADIAAIRGYL